MRPAAVLVLLCIAMPVVESDTTSRLFVTEADAADARLATRAPIHVAQAGSAVSAKQADEHPASAASDPADASMQDRSSHSDTTRVSSTDEGEACGNECWEKGLYVPGVSGTVFAIAAATDTRYFVGGDFASAGGIPTRGIALWESGDWIPLNSDQTSNVVVRAIALDPSDGLPVVAGTFSNIGGTPASNIAKWTGSQWRTLRSGVNGEVYALRWTSPTELLVGGAFSSAGGIAAKNVAQWNGNAWSPVGAGIVGTPLAIVGDGSGGFYVGGQITKAGDVSVTNVARYASQTWSAVGEGLVGTVAALALDGDGNLHAGGSFVATGLGATAAYVANWSGTSWRETGIGMNDQVTGLTTSTNGHVLAVGRFTTADGLPANRVAEWDGSTWRALGGGFNAVTYVSDVTTSGRVLVGGSFGRALMPDNQERTVLSIASWDGESWSQLAGSGFSNFIYGMTKDSMHRLFATFMNGAIPGGEGPVGLASMQNGQWHRVVLQGLPTVVSDIAASTDGKVFLAGHSQWGVSLVVCESLICRSLASVQDYGNALFVDRQDRPVMASGFRYETPGGLVSMALPFGIGRFSSFAYDSKGFSYVSGISSALGSRCVTVKWDERGTSGSELGTDACASMLAVDSNDTVYFLGDLPWQGSIVRGVARWENGQWAVLGGGFGGNGPDGRADALTAIAFDGPGKLYVAGQFSSANGTPANNVAYWDGTRWIALGTGTNGRVEPIVLDRSGILNLGGSFTTAGGKPSAYYARWIPGTVRPFVRASMSTHLNGTVASIFKPGDLLEARVDFRRSEGAGTANTSIQLKLRNQSGVVVLDSRPQNISIPPTGLNWDFGFNLPHTLPAGSYTLSATVLRAGDYRFDPKEVTQAITIQPAPIEDNTKVILYVHGWQGLAEGLSHRHRCTGSSNRDGLRSYVETPEEDRRISVPLKDAGFDVYFANYNTDFVSTDAIADNAKCLATQIADVRQRTGAGKVSLVAHSMGGLVSRAYIEGAGYRGDVTRLVTFGSPHNGLTESLWAWLQIGCLALRPLKHCGDVDDPGFNDLDPGRVHAFNLLRGIPGPDVEYRFIGGTASLGIWDRPLEPLRNASSLVESPNDSIIALRSATGQTDSLLDRNSNLLRQPDGFGYESMSNHISYVDDSDPGRRDANCLRQFFGIAPQAHCDLVRPQVGLAAFSPTGSALALKASVDGRAAGVASPIGKITFRSNGWLGYTDIAGCVEIPVKDGRATCYTPFSPSDKRSFRASYYGVGGLSDNDAELIHLPGPTPSAAGAMSRTAAAQGRLTAAPTFLESASSSTAIARVTGVVAPGAQTQYRLVLDGTEASLLLRWTGGNAQLSFRDPDNRLIDQGNIASLLPGASFNSFDYGDQGSAIAVRLPGAKPGEWTAMVKETGAAKALHFALTGQVSSPIQLTLENPASVGAGRSVAILAFLDQADEPILGATGTVSITEAVTVHGAVLAPSGSGPYQAAVKAPEAAGRYPIVVTMHGHTATGTLYSREWLGTLTVTPAHVSLGGNRSVAAQDPDQDGKYDSLRASGLITVTEAAEYVLRVTAYSPDGEKVAQARSQQQWPVGAWQLSLDIPAEDIQASGLDGTYTVRLEAIRVEPLALQIDNQVVGTSPAYRAADFVAAPPPSPTATPLVTPLPTYTAEPTHTASPTSAPSPSAMPTTLPIATDSPTPTYEPTPSPSATAENPSTPTVEPSATPSPPSEPTIPLPLPTFTPQDSPTPTRFASATATKRPSISSLRIYLPAVRKKR